MAIVINKIALVDSVNTNVSSVSPSLTAVQFLNTNFLRKGATIFNGSNKNIYLLLGDYTDCTISNFTLVIIPQAYYEVPFNYKGPISGVWGDAASNNAQVTELV